LEDLSAAAEDNGEEYYEAEEAAIAKDVAGANDWEADAVGDDVGGGGDDLDFDDDGGAGWGDDALDDFGDLGEPAVKEEVDEMAGLQEVSDDATFKMPTAGRHPTACWVANSSHAADHMAAGAASSAEQLLNRQIAASDFSALKDTMMGTYVASMMSVPGVPGTPSLNIPLLRNDAMSNPGAESLPRTPLKMKHLVAGVRSGYRFFQAGKFNDAKNTFIDILKKIPLVVPDNRGEASEMKEMVEICREYITGIRIRGAITESAADPVRSTELSAYFTHCNLQPAHLLLALRSAMGTAFKHKNYIAAAGFARRLLELPDMSSERNADLRVKATKLLQKSEQMARNEHNLNYNESSSFTIDCRDFVPIPAGTGAVKCSYCGSTYADEAMRNHLCMTCGFCSVGVETIGLVTGS
jgi:coatomer protein complex subunit alpha (xenin)